MAAVQAPAHVGDQPKRHECKYDNGGDDCKQSPPPLSSIFEFFSS